MEQQKELALKMRISSINVIQYLQYDIGDVQYNPDDTVEYNTGFDLKMHEKTEELELISRIKIMLPLQEVEFGELVVAIKFKIHPFSDAVSKKDDNTRKTPRPLIAYLTAVSTNTIRGILHEKLKGTILDKEIFPLINSQDLLINNGSI